MQSPLTVAKLRAFIEQHQIPDDTEILIGLDERESLIDEPTVREAGNLLWEVSSNGHGTIQILPPPDEEPGPPATLPPL